MNANEMAEVGTRTCVPEVGMAASIGVGSDSYAAKITYVSPSGKTIGATMVHFDPEAIVEKRETGGYGHDFLVDVEHPSVELIGGERRARLQPSGSYRTPGKSFIGVGRARDYRDPHV